MWLTTNYCTNSAIVHFNDDNMSDVLVKCSHDHRCPSATWWRQRGEWNGRYGSCHVSANHAIMCGGEGVGEGGRCFRSPWLFLIDFGLCDELFLPLYVRRDPTIKHLTLLSHPPPPQPGRCHYTDVRHRGDIIIKKVTAGISNSLFLWGHSNTHTTSSKLVSKQGMEAEGFWEGRIEVQLHSPMCFGPYYDVGGW